MARMLRYNTDMIQRLVGLLQIHTKYLDVSRFSVSYIDKEKILLEYPINKEWYFSITLFDYKYHVRSITKGNESETLIWNVGEVSRLLESFMKAFQEYLYEKA